ncbi:MAG: FAD-dependent oxidoreductase, partial [Rhodomicrobiaceae bacterium]
MITADVIVIGGGIAGASIAAELSDQLDVTLLEQEPHAGFHATGRSAAVFVPNYGNDTIRALSRESRPQFNDPDDQFWPTPLLS